MKTLPVSFKDINTLRYNKAMADILAHDNKYYRSVLSTPKDSFVISKEQCQKQGEKFFKNSIDEVKDFLKKK